MQGVEVRQQLTERYPGAAISQIPPDVSEPTTMIASISPTIENPSHSQAVVVVDSLAPHYHPNSTQRHEVLKGELILFEGENGHLLREGEVRVVRAGTIHSAFGEATWVKIDSLPGWEERDTTLVEGQPLSSEARKDLLYHYKLADQRRRIRDLHKRSNPDV